MDKHVLLQYSLMNILQWGYILQLLNLIELFQVRNIQIQNIDKSLVETNINS